MPVPLIVLTNGRPECITRTIRSLHENLSGVSGMVIVDDSGDDVYGAWLEDEFIGGPFDGKVAHLPEPHGYWRAMQAVWSLARHWAAEFGQNRFAFWEDDFVLTTPVDLDVLAGVLDAHHWVEHRAVFTGNPSVIPRRTFEQDWPEGAWSESRFGRALFSDPQARGAYWGRRSDPPRVEHIGHQRTGTDY